GKTTFIKLLLGLAHPSAGTVTVLGGSPGDVAVRRRIGYLPERLELPPAFSAFDFLRGVARLKGISSVLAKHEIPRLLSLVGLPEEAWRRKTSAYSKGMKQRAGLAAALLGAPELLVLDEPTDGIDPVGRAQLRDVILSAKRQGVTVFLNSHLLHETERLCDHVAIMQGGRVVRAGATEALRNESAFRVRFCAREGLDEAAARHGFLPDEDARATGQLDRFRLEGADVEVFSRRLAAALAAGLLVVEAQPAMRDLESLLRETIGGPR
ncbi:MAG: ABC transporter ATP-binding protein, partial [Myxococcota bacterium]